MPKRVWPRVRANPVSSPRRLAFLLLGLALLAAACEAPRARPPAGINDAFLQRDLGRLTPWAELTRMSEEIDEMLFAEFRRRRAEGCAGRDDILSMLIEARYEDGSALSDQQLRDEMMTLLVAGHETTTTALAWTLGLVLERPDVRA